MGFRTEIVADTLSTITTESVWQKDGGDLKIELKPGERAGGHVTINSSGSTDQAKVIIYASNRLTPGAVPDSSLALNAQDDWFVYDEFVVDTATAAIDDAPQGILLEGHKFFAATLQRDAGSADTFTGDFKVTQDGVEAS